jgi:hypothetical protein
MIYFEVYLHLNKLTMIAILKAWIFLMILLQNHYFIKYIDATIQNEKSSTNAKLFMTIASITLLYLAATAETTYQTIIRFGVSLLISPIIIFLNLWDYD